MYQLVKLRKLEFYYDFLDYNIDRRVNARVVQAGVHRAEHDCAVLEVVLCRQSEEHR